jgi:hypothetical protein
MNTQALFRATPIFLVLALSLIVLPQGFSQIMPVSQARSVDANAAAAVVGDFDAASDSASALGFEPFDVDVSPVAIAISATDVAIAEGAARQQSSLLGGSVSASGEASSALTLLPVDGGSAFAEGVSIFDLVFTIDTLSSYTLAGTVDSTAIVTGGAAIPVLENEISLSDVINSTVLFQTLTQDESFSAAGIIAPGTYHLTAWASADAEQVSSLSFARTVYGISSFELSLQVTSRTVPDSGGGLIGLAVIALCGFGMWQNKRVCLRP